MSMTCGPETTQDSSAMTWSFRDMSCSAFTIYRDMSRRNPESPSRVARWPPRSGRGGGRHAEAVQEGLDAGPDLVADRAHRGHALTGRVVELPVLVALPGE